MSATRIPTASARPAAWTLPRCRDRVKDLRADGATLNEIRDEMLGRGVPDPFGDGWSRATIRSLLGEATLADLGVVPRGRNSHNDLTPEQYGHLLDGVEQELAAGLDATLRATTDPTAEG